MPAPATLLSMSKPEPGVVLVFVSPDESRVQRLSARLRDLARVQWEKDGTETAATETARRAGTRLLLLDYAPANATAAAELSRRLMLHAPDLSLVGVGATHSDQAVGVLAAWRAGVRDFLDMDAPDEELHTLLSRLQAPAEPARPSPVSAPRPPGRLVLLLGVRPGVGTSTLAAHLGVLAMPSRPAAEAGTADRRALLLDLGRPAGDALLYLGVDSEFHYDDALRSARRIDATLIRTALGHHGSELTLLSQAPGTLEPPRGDGELDALLERLRSHFDLLLCDLGGLPVAQVPPALMRHTDEIWLVTDQGIGAVVSLDALLRDLERAGLRDQRLSLVVNRHDETGGVSAAQIAKRFNLPLLATLPERSRALRASANQGQLLHQVSPRDPYVRALNPLLEKLHVKPAQAATSSWKRVLTGLRGFRWKNS